jgi:carboxyl-terminal processing protease
MTVLVLMLLTAAVTTPIVYEFTKNEFNKKLEETSDEMQRFSKLSSIQRLIDSSYVGQWDQERVLDNAARGMVEGLGDRWSHYLSAEEYQAYKNEHSNEMVGIGVTVSSGMVGGRLRIDDVYTGSPAEEAGLRPADEIYAVDGESVSELDYWRAIDRVRGAENTRVTLGVYRPSDGTSFDVTVTRRVVPVEAVRSEILEGPDYRVGYIRVRNFYTRVDDDFATAVDNLLAADVSAVVFDMRHNPGGELTVMVNMLRKLLADGEVIITLQNKEGNADVYRAEGAAVSLPMAVLIGEESYSAAEFFAAALREYDKAILVGGKTVGKGYGQSAIDLPDGSALLLSTLEYFTPKGNSLAGVGLTPDVYAEETPETLQAFYTDDRQRDGILQAALTQLTTNN